MLKLLNLWIIVFVSLLLISCGKGSGDGGNGGDADNSDDSNLTIEFRGGLNSNLASVSSLALTGTQATNCSVPIPINGGGTDTVDGACLAPIQISGSVANISLGRDSGGPPVRLLGSGTGLGREGNIETQSFDLADPTTLEGEDNVQDDETPSESWNRATVYFSYLDLQFELGGKYWNVRYGFQNEPIISDAVIDSCIVDEGGDEGGEGQEGGMDDSDSQGESSYRDQVIANGYMIGDGAEFQKGDVLFCIKDSADQVCSTEDYQWLDTTSDTFVSTRPDNARQVEAIANQATICEESHDGPGYDVELGGYQMAAGVSPPIKLSAEFVNGGQKVYIFTRNGMSTDGLDMTLYVDFDTQNSVFFKGMTASELAGATDEQIAEAVFLTALYVDGEAQSADIFNYTPTFEVSIDAAVTGEPEPPMFNDQESEE